MGDLNFIATDKIEAWKDYRIETESNISLRDFNILMEDENPVLRRSTYITTLQVETKEVDIGVDFAARVGMSEEELDNLETTV